MPTTFDPNKDFTPLPASPASADVFDPSVDFAPDPAPAPTFKNYSSNSKTILNQNTEEYKQLVADYKAGKMGIGSLLAQGIGATARATGKEIGLGARTIAPQAVDDFVANDVAPVVATGVKKVQDVTEKALEGDYAAPKLVRGKDGKMTVAKGSSPLGQLVTSPAADKVAQILDENPNIQKNAQAVVDTANLALLPTAAGETGNLVKGVVSTAGKGTARLAKAGIVATKDAVINKVASTDLGGKIESISNKATKNYNDQVLNLDANTKRLENSYKKEGKQTVAQILADRDIKIGTRTEPSTGRVVADTDHGIDFLDEEITAHSKLKSEMLKYEDGTVHVDDIESGVLKDIDSNTTMDPTVKQEAKEFFKRWYAAKKDAFAAQPNLTLDVADQIRKWADDLVNFKKHRVTNTQIEKGQEVAGYAARNFIDKVIKETAKDTGLHAMNADLQDIIRARDILQKRNGQIIAKGGIVSGIMRKGFGASIGAAIGGSGVGSIAGAIVGARSADEIASLLQNAPRVIVNRVAKQIAKNNPEKKDIFDEALDILNRKKYQRAQQKRLPAPGQTTPSKVYVSPSGAASKDLRMSKMGERDALQSKANEKSFDKNKKTSEKVQYPYKELPPGRFDKFGNPINSNVTIQMGPKSPPKAQGFNEEAVKSRRKTLIQNMKDEKANVKQKESEAVNSFIDQHVKVFHGTNDNFQVFNPKKGAQGVIWFTDNVGAIKNGTSGAVGTKNIMERYLTGKNFAGWDEYEKLALDQIEQRGFDGIKLPGEDGNNYVLFNNKGIKTKRDLLKMFRDSKKKN